MATGDSPKWLVSTSKPAIRAATCPSTRYECPALQPEARFEASHAKIIQLTEFAFRIGVKTVSAYAFSIENYRRPQSEVDDLMELLKEKLYALHLCAEKYEACVRILGERHLIQEDVLADMEAVEAKTKKNTKYETLNKIFSCHSANKESRAAINICFAYTGRAEITTAIRNSVCEAIGWEEPTMGSKTDVLQSNHEITTASFEKHLYTSDDPPLDMLIRTSGAERLSDFLLWQCNKDTQIYFLGCLWPTIGIPHMIRLLLEWNWRRRQESSRTMAPSWSS